MASQDPFARLDSVFSGDPEQPEDPFGRLDAIFAEDGFQPSGLADVEQRVIETEPPLPVPEGGRPLTGADIQSMKAIEPVEDVRRDPGEPAPDPIGQQMGMGEEIGRSFARFPGQATEAAGAILQMLPETLGTLQFSRPAGEALEEVGRESREHFSMSKEAERAGLTDPRFYAAHVPQGLAQVGSQLAAAGATGGGSLLARLAAFGAPTFGLEGGAHFIETRDRLIEEGMDPEEARRQAQTEAGVVGAASTATEALPGAALLRGGRAAKGPMARAVGRLLAGPAEGVQEATQEAIASGVSRVGGDEEALEGLGGRMAASGAVGAAVGTIAGAGRAAAEARLRGPETDPEAEGEDAEASDAPAVRLSGNERGMLVERAFRHHPERFQSYRNLLVERAGDFGFDREQAEAHVDDISASNRVPELVRVVERDRPVEGELRGAETTILTAGGEEIPAHYALIPSESAPTSHDPESFQPREESPAARYQDRRYHADRAAQEGVTSRAQNLQPQRLIDPSQDPTVGPPIVDPVEDPERAPEMMAEFNDPLTKARDPLAEASVGARRLVESGQSALRHLNETLAEDQTVRQYLDTAAGREFTDRLVQTGVIPQQRAAQLRDDETGLMNAEGRRFVERTLMSAAVGDPDVVGRAPKSHLRKLENALPAIVRTKDVEGWDLSPVLQEALEVAQVARAEDIAPLDLLAQGELLGEGQRFSEPAVRMAAFMEENGPNAVSRALRGYAQDAEASRNEDLFGDRPQSPEESLLLHFGGEQAPQVDVAEPREVQGDLLGPSAPAEGGEQFGLGLQGPTDRGGLSGSEQQARETVERLRPTVEGGEATLDQLQEYREAVALLSREEGQTEELTRLDARIAQQEGTATTTETSDDQPTLLEPDDARSVVERDDPFEVVEIQEPESPIGGRMTGRMEPPPDWEGGPVSRPQVMNELAKALEAASGKVPIRLGRVPAGARGVFKPRPEVVRVRQADDLPNAWHETAHALEKLVYGWPEGSPWTQPLLSERMTRELEALGRALYGDQKPAAGYKREGFAEFLKLWGTRDDRVEEAPTFHEWFEGTFMEEHPKVAEQLETARDATRRWQEQGAAERARQSVEDPASPSRRLRAAWKRIKEFVSLEEQVEGLQPLYELAEVIEERTGEEIPPSEHPYLLPAALSTVESTRTKYWIEHGPTDLAGNPTGTGSMKDMAALVKKATLPDAYAEFSQREAFTIYLYGKRTVALQTDEEGARETGMSLEDARKIVADLSSDEFQTAAGLWYQWHQDLLDYAAEASPTFAEVVRRVRERDPGAYMPLQRVFDDLDDMWSRAVARGGTAGSTSPVSRLKGSARPIKDPIQVGIAQAEMTMRAAHRRLTLDNIIRHSSVEGIGNLIEEVDREVAPVATRDLQEVLDKLRQELVDVADVTVEADEDADLDLTARTLTFFAPAQSPSGPDAPGIVPIYDGEQGTVRWFRMDQDLMRSLEVMVPHRQTEVFGLAVVDEMFKKIARGFRAGTTGLRASFGLVWNMMRDPQTMWVNSRSNASGPKLLAEWLRGMVSVGLNKGTAGGVDPSEWADLYMRLGAEMSQSLGQDIPHTRTAARRLFQGRVVKTLDPRNAFEFYREFVQFPEAAPRIAEMKTVADDIGWSPGEPLTLDQSLQLLLSAKQVTTDFTAAGHFARKANQVVPFYNASIQGPRANLRAARRNPRKFMARGLQLTAVTLLLWWQYRDEEWWKQMDPREKFLHWHFPIDWPESTLMRVPRAFEVGLVFSALPEALADGWYQQDPEAVKEWMDVFVEASSPPVTPQPLAVAFEQLANERFFFDSPIVPMSLERKPAEEQYNEYTSRLAVELGDVFGVSPMRIDHAIDQTIGPVGGDVLDVLGLGPPDLEREKELADTPIVGRMFQRGGKLGRIKTVDELYDTLAEAQKRQASDRREETPRQRQLRLQLTDAANAISALYYVRSHTEAAEQRRQLNTLLARFSEDALQTYRAGSLERGRFKTARREAERMETRRKRELQGPRRRPVRARGDAVPTGSP